MKTGKELITYLYITPPQDRAEYLINEIEPYLRKDMNPKLTREEALNITINKAAELFNCPVSQVDACYKEYKYFVPIVLWEDLFIEKTSRDIKRFIPEISKVIFENNAKSLWETEKKEIDEKYNDYIRSGLPASECIKEIKNKYRIWSTVPTLEEDKLLYFCWSTHIDPYLKKLCPDETSKAVKTHSFPDLFFNKKDSEVVIKILKDEDYLISGKWHYSGDDKTIAIPFYVLRDYFGLIKQSGSPEGTKLKTWCSGLGITKTDGQIRSLKNNPDIDGKNPTHQYRQKQKEFFEIFKSQFKPTKDII